jgi:hypothetical protein
MARLLSKAALAAAVFMLAGCGGPAMLRSDTSPQKESLVFGYIDMDEAPVSMDWMQFRQVLPKTDDPLLATAVDDGLFYSSRLRPGAYEVDTFGGHTFLGNTYYTFQIPRQSVTDFRFKFNKAGVYFLGSFKYKKVDTGFFGPIEFSVERIAKPTERELLQRMLDEAKTDAWKARINLALKELDRK